MEFLYNLFFLVILFILLLFKLAQKTHPHLKLPPGPHKLPIIGSIHHLMIGSQLPHHRFAELSNTYGPLVHLKLGEVSMVVASSPEAACEIMKTQDTTFATRPLFPAAEIFTYSGKNISFAPYGEYWRQLRKICVLELLSAKRVQSFRCIREEEVQSLIQSISLSARDGSIVNLSKMVAEMTNNVIMKVLTGDKFKNRDELLESLNEGIELMTGVDLTDLFPSLSWLMSLLSRTKSRVERTHKKLDKLLGSIIQEKRAREKIRRAGMRGEEQVSEDLVDVLLRLQDEGGLQYELTSDGIKALILDMFGGGSETTSSTLQWAMSELMRNPRVMRKAQTEVRNVLEGKDRVTEADINKLNYLQLVIKETFRLHPPLPLLLPRLCEKNSELFGYEIPARTRVAVNVWAIGRDPKYWEDAEEFKPERFEGSSIDFKGTNFELLPFGAGRRMCPGMLFGLAGIDLALAQLLYYFNWKLPTASEIKSKTLDMSEAFGITAHRRFDLLLQATSHVPYPTT